MPRHSKNLGSSTIFKPSERAKLKYGTQSVRATTDNAKEFSSCTMCLHPAQDPLMCLQGHLFCKSCIYENLLTQKEHIKRQMKAYESQQQLKGDDAANAEANKQRILVEKFHESEKKITSENRSLNADKSSKSVPVGYIQVQTEDGKTAFVPDRKYVSEMMVGSAQLSKEQRSERAAMLPSFWIPNLTPDEGDKSIKKPVEHTCCPAGGHFLRLKQLFPVKFTYDRSENTSSMSISSSVASSSSSSSTNNSKTTNSETDIYAPICSSCKKTFHKISKASCIKSCGHVICQSCVDQFVSKDNACVDCGVRVDASDVILIAGGASGFAAGGGTMLKKLVSPSFMSW
jgi:nitric oxide synthase-interacting protein